MHKKLFNVGDKMYVLSIGGRAVNMHEYINKINLKLVGKCENCSCVKQLRSFERRVLKALYFIYWSTYILIINDDKKSF